jgi:ubiquinone biosynthesis protein
MAEQVGIRGMFERLKVEAPRYTHIIPQLPRLINRALQQAQPNGVDTELLKLLVLEQRRTNRMLGFVVYFAAALGIGLAAIQLYMHLQPGA